MSNKVQSGFLFADPSFLSGASRSLDLWGQYDQYNRSLNGAEADARAIAADWIITGQDIKEAMDEFDSEDAA